MDQHFAIITRPIFVVNFIIFNLRFSLKPGEWNGSREEGKGWQQNYNRHRLIYAFLEVLLLYN